MLKRRHFLKQSSAFALGSLLLPSCISSADKSKSENDSSAGDSTTNAQRQPESLAPIGVQLWSVKDVVEKDLQGTLKQLAAIGYKEIESYPGAKGHYYGVAPKEFKKMIDDTGMKLVSSHVPTGAKKSKPGTWQQATLLQNFNEFVDNAAETGQLFVTCSWMDETLRGDLKGTAELFNKSAEACKKAGLQFAYHNHDFEFNKVGDEVIYDYMLNNTDATVKYEMDMFWVVKAGRDPKAYFAKYPNRFSLCHIKDMDKQNRNNNTEIGTGSIDYADLLKAAKDAGMKHFLVEQESFTKPSIESMKMNYTYLSTLKV
jgi:sugar phosphate isomerase/epimerase